MSFVNGMEAKSGSHAESESTTPGTPTSEGVTRNANRAFAFTKLFNLARSGNYMNSGFLGSQTKKDPPLMEEVDHVLASTASDAEAKDVLRGMVADLLSENDALRRAVSKFQKAMNEIQDQNNHLQNDYRHQLKSLQASVERNCGGAAVVLECDKSKALLSPLEVSNAVIQGLTHKVETVTTENAHLEHDLICTRERMEDLESLNEARLHTIEALENQFLAMNQTYRQRYQQKLRSESNRRTNSDKHIIRSPLSPLNIPPSSSNTCLTTPPSSDCTKSSSKVEMEEWNPFDDYVHGIGASEGEI